MYLLPIMGILDNAKYSFYLEELINELNGVEVLYKNYNSDENNGFVEIGVILQNKNVICFNYDFKELDKFETDKDYIKMLLMNWSIKYKNIDEYKRGNFMKK